MIANAAMKPVTSESLEKLAMEAPDETVAAPRTAEAITRTRSEPNKPPDPAQGRAQFVKSNSASVATPKQGKKQAERKTVIVQAVTETKEEDRKVQEQVSDESALQRPAENRAEASEVHADFPVAAVGQDLAAQLEQLPTFARIASAKTVDELNKVIQELALEKSKFKRSEGRNVYCVWVDLEGGDEAKMTQKIRFLEPSILPSAIYPISTVDEGKMKKALHVQVQGLLTRDALVAAARRESIRLHACFVTGRCGCACDPKVYPHAIELHETTEPALRNQAASSRPVGDKDDIGNRASTWLSNKVPAARVDKITANRSPVGIRIYVLFNTAADEEEALKVITEKHANKVTLSNKMSFEIKLKKKSHERYFVCLCGERGHGLFTPCPYKDRAVRLRFNRAINAYDVAAFRAALPNAKLMLTSPGAAQSAMAFPADAREACLISTFFVELEPGLFAGVTRLMTTGLAAETQACCRYCSSPEHNERDCNEKRSTQEATHKEYVETTYAAVFRRQASASSGVVNRQSQQQQPQQQQVNRQRQQQQQQQQQSQRSPASSASNVGVASPRRPRGGLGEPTEDGFQEVIGRTAKKQRMQEPAPFQFHRVQDSGGTSPRRKQVPRAAAPPPQGVTNTTIYTGTRSDSGSFVYQPKSTSDRKAEARPTADVTAKAGTEVVHMEEDHDDAITVVSPASRPQDDGQSNKQADIRSTTASVENAPRQESAQGAMDC